MKYVLLFWCENEVRIIEIIVIIWYCLMIIDREIFDDSCA